MTYPLIATSTFGLEGVVIRELRELGYPARSPRTGRIEFEGGDEAIARTNLWLRSSDRVLLRVARFPATDFEDLFEGVRALPWKDWIPVDAAFPVAGRSQTSKLESVPAVQRATKKAIVESLLDGHRVHSLPETGPTFGVAVELVGDIATLTLDTSGDGLHKRGYRDLVGAAPLRETLAAALVDLSFWRPGRPFLDPFCGSGTIAIEAAMIGRDLAPGRNRTFAAERWPFIATSAWEQARTEAQDRERPADFEPLLARDIDPEPLSLAKRHAARAGVSDSIRFERADFLETNLESTHGNIVTNPPWGIRLQDQHQLEPLYDGMAEVFARLPTWSFFVLTAWPEFEKTVGREADRRRKLYNARVESTYFQFHGPRPPRPTDTIATSADKAAGEAASDSASDSEAASAPAVAAADAAATTATAAVFVHDPTPPHLEAFGNRLRKVDRHRRRWPSRRGVPCYRIYDADLPDIGVVVERFGDEVRVASAPSINLPGQAPEPPVAPHRLKRLGPTIAKALDLDAKHIFFAGDKHDAKAQRCVEEAGVTFLVDLNAEQNCGLDLSYRELRKLVRDSAAGRRVLDGLVPGAGVSAVAMQGGAERVKRLSFAARTEEERVTASIARNAFDNADRFESEAAARPAPYDFVLLDLDALRMSQNASRITLDRPALEGATGEHFADSAQIYIVANGAAPELKKLEGKDLSSSLRTEDCESNDLRVVRLAEPTAVSKSVSP